MKHEAVPQSSKPNYLARRAAAVLLAVSVPPVGLKVVAGTWNSLKGQDVPELNAENPNMETIIVQSGDNAWTIADERLGDDRDVRPLVASILEQPDARDGLHPGDKLVVPKKNKP